MINYKNLNKLLINLPNNLPIYFAGHIKPDPDSICSCLALAEYLKNIGKNVKVLLNKKDESIIDWLNDNSLIVNQVTDNKYNFIALDVNEKSRLGEYEKDFDRAITKINIDHHQNNKYEANYTLSEPGKSSTCELIFNLIGKKENLTLKICNCLYAGMMADTNCFTRRLSNKTLVIAQKLINFGINYVEIIKETFSKRSMYEFKAMAKLVDELKFEGFHYVIADKEKEEFKNLSHNSLVKVIAEELRKIDEIDIFLLLIKNGNTITVKTMSNKCEIADKIAGVFGGGGHKKEAGFTVEDMSVDQIILKTKEFLKSINKI
ncbi:MAG: DHH family phosphoesterase [Clostridia bacterium]|nr:DHH family phosphoesterase [Clostridia bacterium]